MRTYGKSLLLASFLAEICVFVGCTDPPTITPTSSERHFTGFVETDKSHMLIVSDVICNRTPVPTGWEVAVFTPDNFLGGAIVWHDGETNLLPAWGSSDMVVQFRTEQNFQFRLWDNQNNKEYPADAFYASGRSTWSEGNTSKVILDGYTPRVATISLAKGWNLISLNIWPSPLLDNANGTDVRKLMSQFSYGNGSHLLMVKNERGNFYAPANRDFNNIPFWNVVEGYWLMMDTTMTASWSGRPIDAGLEVPIAGGWNLISYLPNYPLSCNRNSFTAISSIKESVVLLKDFSGHFASPHQNFSNMGLIEPNDGLMINTRYPVNLVYPGPETNPHADNYHEIPVESGPWAIPEPTAKNMSLLVLSVEGVEIKDGDVIVAVSSSDQVLGLGNIRNGQAGLAIFGDDPMTNAKDGGAEGETFSLKHWSSATGSVTELEMTGLTYHTDGFVAETATAVRH